MFTVAQQQEKEKPLYSLRQSQVASQRKTPWVVAFEEPFIEKWA